MVKNDDQVRLRNLLLWIVLGVIISTLLIFSFTFAHEASVPKAISGLTIFWLFLPLFVVYIYRRGLVELPLFFSFFLVFFAFFLSGFSFQALNWDMIDRVDYLVYLYIFVITYLIFLSIYNLRPAINEKKIFLGVIFGLSILEAVIGLLQYKGLGEIFPPFSLGNTKVSGTLGYSNYLGFFLSLGVVSAFFFWLKYYNDWFRERRLVSGAPFLLMVGFVFAILNITGSRAGIIDTILGLAVFLLLVYRFKGKEWLLQMKSCVILFFATLFLAAMIVNINIEKSGGTTALNEFSEDITAPGSTGDRLVMWLSAIEMFKEHSITGVGLGNYSNHYSDYMKKVLISYPSDVLKGSATFHLHTHNDYLEIMAETGALGLIAFLFFIFSLGKRCKASLRHTMSDDKLLTITFAALTIPFFFDALVSQTLHYFPFLVLFAVILGQMIPKKGERHLHLNKRYLKASFVIVMFLSIINIRTMIDIGRADIELEKGFITRDISYFSKAMENPVVRSDALPFYGQLLFEGGMARDDRELIDEGLKVMKEYYLFQPSARAAHSIGLHYITLGDKKEALRWWEEGLNFQPNFQPIRSSIERLSSPEKKEKNIFEILKKRLKEKKAGRNDVNQE